MTTTVNNTAEDRLLAELDKGDGFATVTLGQLKEIVGVKRLGKYVLEDIKTWLRRQGLGYFPKAYLEENQEPRQDQEVRLYRNDRTSARAALIEAVLDPSPQGDKQLLELTKDDSSAQRVKDLESRIERAKAAVDDAVRELDGLSEL